MNILFFCFHGMSADSGVSKKMLAQVDALRNLGHHVWVCTYDVAPNGHCTRRINDKVLQDFGPAPWGAIRQRCHYGSVVRFVREQKIDLVYIRSWHNADPWTIRFCRQLRHAGARVAMEIPTWPYDQEYATAPLKYKIRLSIDKLFRRRLAKAIDAFVTFSSHNQILGQRAICISNGFPLAIGQDCESVSPPPLPPLRLLAVAEVHYWHGLDRIIKGLAQYNGPLPVELHIVGPIGQSEMFGSSKAEGIATLIERHGLQERVILHGPLHSEALEEQYRMAHFAIGSLGRHRSGIDSIKTLKNREYAARGLAFCYSEHDDDFDHQPYVLRLPPDESPIDIQEVVRFATSLKMQRGEIAASVRHLSWECQMKRVIDEI